MESGSQSSSSQSNDPPGQSPQKLANIIGTLIAVLTLAAPLFSIARFSSPSYKPSYDLMLQYPIQSPVQLLPDTGTASE